MKQYTAAIIGCGSIGAMKPDEYDSPSTENVLTHAHALHDNERVSDVLFMDTDEEQLDRAIVRWAGIGVTSVEKLAELNPDILVIAVPTEEHYGVLFEILAKLSTYAFDGAPRAIVLEKPCGTSLQDIRNIERILGHRCSGRPVFVNYSRRYNHHYQELANELQDNTIFHCRVAYTRGFQREACHALDLCNWWFGAFYQGRILGLSIADHSDKDLTRAAWLEYQHCPHVFLCPSDSRDYGVFEIDIFTKNVRLRLVDNGRIIKRHQIIPEPIYGNYNIMNDYGWTGIETNIEKTCLPNLYENVIAAMEGRSKPVCGIGDAVRVHEIYRYLGVQK